MYLEIKNVQFNTGFLFVVMIFCHLGTGCDNTFEPLQENDQYHFSIYGYLDASADTQWVRVMPIRENILYDSTSIEATVTLEHLNSSESVTLNDSLVQFAHNRYAWNFWTTMDILPEQSYRLTAEWPDGRTSHAQVTLPEDFPAPYIQISHNGRREPEETTVFIEGIEHLADVQTVYRTPNKNIMISVPHLKDSVRTESSDLYRIVMDPQEDLLQLDLFFPLTYGIPTFQEIGRGVFVRAGFHMHIFIASGGPEYDHFSSIDGKVEALPEGISNVENGVGYLAGIVSKTIPYRACWDGRRADPITCGEEPPPW